MFIVNLSLKWGTVLVCRSTRSKDIDQNVWLLIPQFSWLCIKNEIRELALKSKVCKILGVKTLEIQGTSKNLIKNYNLRFSKS